jgi:hypothetical protein
MIKPLDLDREVPFWTLHRLSPAQFLMPCQGSVFFFYWLCGEGSHIQAHDFHKNALI